MACPFSHNSLRNTNYLEEEDATYSGYLKLSTLLTCTEAKSKVHDEHLFILIHQVYELWFKQILHEIDSVREIFSHPIVDERMMLKVNTRLGRITKIFSILVDQVSVLETMTPLDFAEFREGLKTASGFQSWQFRLIENKLGVQKKNRLNLKQTEYIDIYDDEIRAVIENSENEPSIFELVEKWLERTPGLVSENFSFWNCFVEKCKEWFRDEKKSAYEEPELSKRDVLIEISEKNQVAFEQILYKEKYEILLKKGDRSLSWRALQGALMIYYNRNEVLFHEAFQMMSHLMDIDNCICKWRHNHILLVQRQIGTKLGTGGSSGYYYLRATISDRYRPFLDLFRLSNYLMPIRYIKDMHPI